MPVHWRTAFALALLPALLMAALALRAPESARWLVLQGCFEDAESALVQAQGLSPAAARVEVEAMVAMAAVSGPASRGPLAQLLGTRQNRKALTIGVGLVLLQQLSGQPSLLYYARRIFESAGLGTQVWLTVQAARGLRVTRCNPSLQHLRSAQRDGGDLAELVIIFWIVCTKSPPPSRLTPLPCITALRASQWEHTSAPQKATNTSKATTTCTLQCVRQGDSGSDSRRFFSCKRPTAEHDF